MKKKLLTACTVLLVLAGFGGTGYLWHVKNGLETQIVGLNTDLEASKRKTRAAMKKYSEEKAKVNTCMRGRMALEAQNGKLMMQARQLKAQNQEMAANIESIKEQFKAKVVEFNEKVLKMKAYKQKLDKSKEALVEKYNTLLAKGRELQAKYNTLELEKTKVDGQLAQTESRLNRSLKHNEKLCVIAEELTNKYRKKTNGTEPFTQIRMVEVEHMIQEYVKRIDQEKIIEQ
jgi:chromosome segregation ATPase